MPHRVANFLRNPSGNISHIKISRSRNTSANTSRNNSVCASPYASDSEDHASHPVKMPELGDALKKHHRLGLHFGRSSKHDGSHHPQSSSSSSSAGASGPAVMSWSIESPPIVFYGTPEESTGALVSGLMYIDVNEDAVDVDSFNASLSMHVTQKKPFHGHCAECQTSVTELKSWQFLAHPTTLRRGRHQFPFSTLLDGTLPASMDSPIVSISYHFKAEAVTARSPSSPLRFERTLDVKRSLPEPLYPHHSIRVFPPTNIKASAHYTAVIHPSGSNKVTLKLDGLMTHNERVKTVDLWKLKKLTWRLEETIKTTAPACDRHAPASPHSSSSSSDEEPKKGVVRTETRVLGEKQVHEGWKSDYSGNDGTVDFEFDYLANQIKQHAKEPRFACDLRTQDGTTAVTHALHLELIVSKEFAPEGKTQLAAQTGTGRILRMHFAVNMTEYPGLGVSWDNEAPPVYEDVPPSPPGYPTEPPIEYDDLEELDALRTGSEPGSRRHSESGPGPA